MTQLQFWSFDVKTFCNRRISNKLNCFYFIAWPSRRVGERVLSNMDMCHTLCREGTLSREGRRNTTGKILRGKRNYMR